MDFKSMKLKLNNVSIHLEQGHNNRNKAVSNSVQGRVFYERRTLMHIHSNTVDNT